MRRYGIVVVGFALLSASSALAQSPTPVKAATDSLTFGVTREGAIEVCEPKGERGYLERLVCEDGKAPSFKRAGSIGRRTAKLASQDSKEEMLLQGMGAEVSKPGGADYHVLDAFEVKCSTKTFELLLDMYHCKDTPKAKAPAGFTLKEGK